MKEAYKITKYLITIWHVDPLLDNDREISSYTTAFAKYWLYKQRPLLGNSRNGHARNNIRDVESRVLCAIRAKIV
jgi:hypothetical protein